MTLDSCACYDSLKLYAKFIGEFTTFCKEFETYLLNGGLVNFAIYKYVVHNCLLADGMAVEEFDNKFFHIGVTSGELFALLGFENDVLHSLHLGGRTCKSTLLEVCFDVCSPPLLNGNGSVGIVFCGSGSLLILHHALSVLGTRA